MKKTIGLFVAAAFTLSTFTTAFAAPVDKLSGAEKFLKGKFNIQDVSSEFKELRVKNDELGYKHVKLQQLVGGVPVYGSEYIVHFDGNGNVYASNGKYDSSAKNFKAKGQYIKADAAIKTAKADINFTEESAIVNDNQDLITSELYLYEVKGEYTPVYLVRVNWLHEDSFGDWRVFVDAVTGQVVDKYNAIAFGKPTGGTLPTSGTNVTGTGVGVLGDSKSIKLLQNGSTYYLMDKSRTNMSGIYTYNANNGTSLPGTMFTDIDTTWNSSIQNAAVDAHAYASATYDYYYNALGRNSIDDRGMLIKSTVHYSRSYVNAFWNGTQMVYGDGDGVQSLALSGGLDVIAHEMAHGVTSYEANLVYRDQSGALNECMSDVFGTAVEFAVQPQKADWLVGEDIWTPKVNGDALRSMADPTIYGDPAHMNNYLYTTQDNGGVHTNSGIPNKAAYLVGSSIGVDKMAKIYYRALTVYMTSSTNFSQARATLLQSAADLYGANGTEYNAVANAFNAVGIY
jgi:Zn-dependent metalloprotease